MRREFISATATYVSWIETTVRECGARVAPIWEEYEFLALRGEPPV